MGTLAELLWLSHKLIFGAVLAVVALAGLGFWVYFRDQVDFDLRRLEIVRALTGETAQVRSALSDVEARMSAMRVEVTAQQERTAQAAKVANELESLGSGLNRLTTDSAQLRENEERLARMRQMQAESLKRTAELQENLKRTQWEKDGLEIALGRMQLQLRSAEENKSKVVHYVREAWSKHGPYVLSIVGPRFLGPPLARIFAYVVFAPLVSGRAPVLLGW